MDSKENNVIHPEIFGTQTVMAENGVIMTANNNPIDHVDTSDDTSFNSSYNGGNSGGNNMDDKYVTHEELELETTKINNKIDLFEAHLDTKFEAINTKFESVNTKFESVNTTIEKQNVTMIKWFIGTALTIIGVVIALKII